jgi:hypothetical protein
MAKQTFTTGQVLTAAQVTALQTNNYNQTVTTVTTNYTLLAADVGTRVYMNAAGATTITVNTGVFAAGDTVWLGNIGAGACVVTAGTATVSKFSTASLTLSQYQGAYLYFVSTGIAILYSDSAGASTPLTTKGDLFGYDTANARIPIGTNNQVLTADSTQALGLKWAAAASPSYTWTSFTPSFFQSASLSLSANTSKYTSVGDIGYLFVNVTFSSAGTANNVLYFTIPAGPITPDSTQMMGGWTNIYDTSAATRYNGAAEVGGSYFYFQSGVNKANATVNWGQTGSDFPIAIANGDTLSAYISYKKA